MFPETKNNPFIEYQTEHYQTITEVSSEVAEKVGNGMEAILQEYSGILPFPKEQLPSSLFRVSDLPPLILPLVKSESMKRWFWEQRSVI